MLNSLSDSIRERQQEKKMMTPKEEKRLRSRNDELENKIEHLSKKNNSIDEEKPSFFEKIRNRGTILEEKQKTNQTLLTKIPVQNGRSVPVITKNVDASSHSDIKPFQGSWQYPQSNLLTYHPKGKPLTREEIELQSAIIEKTLLQFGIEVSMEGFEV